MNSLLIVEVVFILFNLFFLLRNILKRIRIKKEGTYTSIKNFNSMFVTTTIVCIAFIVYIFVYSHEFTNITRNLAILILIILIISNFLNANILFGHNSFSYMYYNRSYKNVKKVSVLDKGAGRLITFQFKSGSSFSFTTSKKNGSIILEILKRKSLSVTHTR